MNTPIRRLSTFVALLFTLLLISTTWIQFVQAKSLNAREGNRRTLLSSYAQQRGQILVGNEAIASSAPSNDEFKYQRGYANAAAYAHVTGYYSFTYGAGAGIEASENSLLSGRSDKLFYRRVSDLFTGRKAQGASVHLTLNPAVQQAAIDGLGGQKGAAVAIDPKTGAILAMVSAPSYDPNALASHDLTSVTTAWKTLNADPAHPMVNRAIAGNLYPPGSTFKIVTAAAALESGKFQPDTKIPGPAVLTLPQTTAGLATDDKVPCGPNDETNLADAVRTSCNSAFGWLGMQLGGDALRSQAEKFGFGQSATVPMRASASSVPAELNPPQLAQSAIGQYDVRVTPLQVAMIASGVANDGVVMKPYLVGSVLAPDLSTIDTTKPEQLSRAVSSNVAKELTTMMEAAVNNGTGGAAKIPGVRVAGKTGTAQHAAGAAPHAWFMCFAPADNPKIAIAVVVEDGGKLGNEAFGGTVAAPIARGMIEAALR